MCTRVGEGGDIFFRPTGLVRTQSLTVLDGGTRLRQCRQDGEGIPVVVPFVVPIEQLLPLVL